MSIVEIAKIAGVSKTTVSRVINDSSKVSPETVRMVHKAMVSSGYKIPQIRRGPKKRVHMNASRNAVEVIILGYNFSQIYKEGSGYAEILHGIESALSENGLKMVVATFENPSDASNLEIFQGNSCGIIVVSRNEKLPLKIKALANQIPVVRVNPGWKQSENAGDEVKYDNSLVGELAAVYLKQRGHSLVGYLSPYPRHEIHIERQNAFTRKAVELGMKVQHFVSEKDEIVHADLSVENTRSLVKRLLDNKENITGVFITYVIRAMHAYNEFRANGIEPMKDIDIITADNIAYYMDQMSPRPAVVDTKVKLLGEKAVEQVLWRLKHPNENSHMKLSIQPTLIEKVEPWKSLEL